jgi:hypothetical protein
VVPLLDFEVAAGETPAGEILPVVSRGVDRVPTTSAPLEAEHAAAARQTASARAGRGLEVTDGIRNNTASETAT